MPYTPKERRPVGNQEYKSIHIIHKGDLTAAIFDLMLKYIDSHDLNYQNISDSMAAAQDAVFEIQRRIVAPYEDYCIGKNGDFNRVEKILSKMEDKFHG